MTTDLPTAGASRRVMIASLLAAPTIIASGAVAAQTLDADVKFRHAWHQRQSALSSIESRGSYFDCEFHSPSEADAFSEVEDVIHKTPAHTIAGALIKAWVAFSFCGTAFNEHEAEQQDLIRRADLPTVQLIRGELEYDLLLMLDLIETLSRLVEA